MRPQSISGFTGFILLVFFVRLHAAPGDLDISFQSTRGASDTVQCILEEPDGKFLIVGDFLAADGIPRNRIARLNADGTLDRRFLSGLVGVDAQVRVILREPDGRILLGGAFRNVNGVPRAHIARLQPDGSLDVSFLRGLPGVDATTFGIYSIARQPDGKILIGGNISSVNGERRTGIARLHPDGSLDPTFVINLTNSINTDGTVRCIALLADGDIMMAGTFQSVNGQPRRGIARLHSDGTVDESFQAAFDDTSYQVRALRMQPDGKILIGGSGISIGGVDKGFVSRLNSDGSEDLGFTTSSNGADTRAIVLQPDGKIIAAGQSGSSGYVVRRNPDGSSDSSFFAPHFQTAATVQCLHLRQDGSVLAGGTFTKLSSTNGPANNLVQLKPDGQLDSGFLTAQSGPNATVTCLLEQPDGKLLAGGGFTGINSQSTGPLARLNRDGTADHTFANPLQQQFGSNLCLALAAGGDTNFVAGGSFLSVQGSARHNVARFTSDGQLDTAFQPGNLEVSTWVSALARQPDGRILLATADPSSLSARPFLLARINADGTRDTAFVNGLAGVARNIYSLAVLPDGKLLAAGEAVTPNNTITLKRLHSDGSLDATFSAPALIGPRIRSLAVQSDGKVVFGGSFTWTAGTSHSNIGRLNVDGTLDTGYMPGQAGPNGQVYSIALQSDGKPVIGGEFTTVSGTSRNRIARLNPDGTLDTTFLNTLAGIEQSPIITSSPFPSVQTVMVQSDGKIVAGGVGFNKVNGVVRNNIVRLHGDAPDIAVEYLSGTPLLHDVGPAVDFGPVLSGAPATLMLVIRNTGNRSLSAPALAFSPVSSPHRFSIVTNPGGGDLVPGASATFTLGFNPDASGAATALLEIVSNDPDESPFLLRLTGSKATSLDLWRRQHFGTFSNTGTAADSADPDNDGIINLLEFATGSMPNIRSLPPWGLHLEENEVTFYYTRPSSALEALRYNVEWNDGLSGTWQSASQGLVAGEVNGNQTVLVTFPTAAATRRFFRLRVRKLL